MVFVCNVESPECRRNGKEVLDTMIRCNLAFPRARIVPLRAARVFPCLCTDYWHVAIIVCMLTLH